MGLWRPKRDLGVDDDYDYDDGAGERLSWSRLHAAMVLEWPLTASVWHRHGADLHAQDQNGQTPLAQARFEATVDWALSQGAVVAHRDQSDQLPWEIWRRNSDEAELSKMLARANVSSDQSMLLMQTAIEAIDDSGFSAAWAALGRPDVVLPRGRSPLVVIGLAGLLEPAVSSRSMNRQKSLSKMMVGQWSKADLTFLEHHRPQGGLSDLDVAWVCSMCLRPNARQAAHAAFKRGGFLPPSPFSVMAWAGSSELTTEQSESEYARRKVRAWALEQASDDYRKDGDHGKALAVTKALLETGFEEMPSASTSERAAFTTLVGLVFHQFENDPASMSSSMASDWLKVILQATPLYWRQSADDCCMEFLQETLVDFDINNIRLGGLGDIELNLAAFAVGFVQVGAPWPEEPGLLQAWKQDAHKESGAAFPALQQAALEAGWAQDPVRAKPRIRI